MWTNFYSPKDGSNSVFPIAVESRRQMLQLLAHSKRRTQKTVKRIAMRRVAKKMTIVFFSDIHTGSQHLESVALIKLLAEKDDSQLVRKQSCRKTLSKSYTRLVSTWINIPGWDRGNVKSTDCTHSTRMNRQQKGIWKMLNNNKERWWLRIKRKSE